MMESRIIRLVQILPVSAEFRDADDGARCVARSAGG
jgi:hypothetical protein